MARIFSGNFACPGAGRDAFSGAVTVAELMNCSSFRGLSFGEGQTPGITLAGKFWLRAFVDCCSIFLDLSDQSLSAFRIKKVEVLIVETKVNLTSWLITIRYRDAGHQQYLPI